MPDNQSRYLDHEMIAQHFDFLAKILRNTKSLKILGAKKARPTWQVAAEEAEEAAAKIRAALASCDEQPLAENPKGSSLQGASAVPEGQTPEYLKGFREGIDEVESLIQAALDNAEASQADGDWSRDKFNGFRMALEGLHMALPAIRSLNQGERA